MQNIGGKGGGEVNRVYYKQCENGKFWSLPSVPLALVLLWRREKEKEEKDEFICFSCSPYRLVIFSWFLLKNFHAKRRPLMLLATVPMIWIMSCVRTILSSKACFSNLKIKIELNTFLCSWFFMGSLKGRHLYRWRCCCEFFLRWLKKPTTQVNLYRLKEGNIRYNIVRRGCEVLIGTKDH